MQARPMRRLAIVAAATLLTACAGSHYQPRTLSGSIASSAKNGDTVIRLRLLDTGNSGAAAALLGEQIINRPPRMPAPYALQYDGMAISQGHSYEIDVELFAAGELRERATRTLAAGSEGLPATLDLHTSPLGK